MDTKDDEGNPKMEAADMQEHIKKEIPKPMQELLGHLSIDLTISEEKTPPPQSPTGTNIKNHDPVIEDLNDEQGTNQSPIRIDDTGDVSGGSITVRIPGKAKRSGEISTSTLCEWQ